MVQQAIIADEMFEALGLEEEEFFAAIQYHKVMDDPDVKSMLMEHMQKLSMAGGGMF